MSAYSNSSYSSPADEPVPAGPRRFRKKPVIVEAIRYDGTNPREVIEWSRTGNDNRAFYAAADGTLVIETLEGNMRARVGDWIIRGVAGEVYPCHPQIFADTYEEVPE